MIAISEITATLSGIKKAIGVVKSLTSLDSHIALKSKTSELLSIIVDLHDRISSIQSQYDELLNTKNDLEKKLMEIEKWVEEKAKYKLTEISPGVFVFLSKEVDRSITPSHWLCAHCYENRQKSILQLHNHSAAGKTFKCPSCKNVIHIPAPNRKKGLNL